MRTWRLALVLAALTPLSAAQAQGRGAYTFAGMPWGFTAQAVKDTLVAKGYAFVKQDGDSDLVFKGDLARTPAEVYALLDPSRKLVEVIVALLTEDQDARPVYHATAEKLRAKYGAPDVTRAEVDAPYRAGDGKEDQAIRDGKGHYAMCWNHGQPMSKSDGESLCVGITERLTVDITYESSQWTKEAERRSMARAAKDL